MSYINEHNISEDSITNIYKLTLKEYCQLLENDEADGTPVLSVDNVFVNNQEISFDENNTIWIILVALGPGPIDLTPYLYYKFGESPLGTYTKNNLKFNWTTIEELQHEYDYIVDKDDDFFINTFGKPYEELQTTIIATETL